MLSVLISLFYLYTHGYYSFIYSHIPLSELIFNIFYTCLTLTFCVRSYYEITNNWFGLHTYRDNKHETKKTSTHFKPICMWFKLTRILASNVYVIKIALTGMNDLYARDIYGGKNDNKKTNQGVYIRF